MLIGQESISVYTNYGLTEYMDCYHLIICDESPGIIDTRMRVSMYVPFSLSPQDIESRRIHFTDISSSRMQTF